MLSKKDYEKYVARTLEYFEKAGIALTEKSGRAPCNFSAKSLLTETLSSVMMLWKWQPPMAGPMWTACGSVIT